MKRRTVLGMAAILSCHLALPSASLAKEASGYPNRPITLVVPYAPGGSTDAVARDYALRLSKMLSVPIVIENKAGAGGSIGAQYVAKAKPDGYTLLFGTSAPLAANFALFPNIPYHPIKDFTPINRISIITNLLTVNSKLGVKNYEQLVSVLKKSGSKFSYASGGTGTTQHIAGELFRVKTGFDIVHIPYKGEAPAMIAIVGGEVQLAFSGIPVAMPFIQDGKIAPIAVTSKERSKLLPDTPTMIEMGLSDFDVSAWSGVVAPAGTPADVIATLGQAGKRIVEDDEEFARNTVRGGGIPAYMNAKDFSALMVDELPRWQKLIEITGARP